MWLMRVTWNAIACHKSTLGEKQKRGALSILSIANKHATVATRAASNRQQSKNTKNE